MATLTGHSGIVRYVAFLSEQELMSCSEDKFIRFWQLSDALVSKERRTVTSGHTSTTSNNLERKGYHGTVVCLKYQPNSDFIVASGQNETVERWHAKTGVSSVLLRARRGDQVLAWSPDG